METKDYPKYQETTRWLDDLASQIHTNSSNPSFEPIVIEAPEEGVFKVIAGLVKVL